MLEQIRARRTVRSCNIISDKFFIMIILLRICFSLSFTTEKLIFVMTHLNKSKLLIKGYYRIGKIYLFIYLFIKVETEAIIIKLLFGQGHPCSNIPLPIRAI